MKPIFIIALITASCAHPSSSLNKLNLSKLEFLENRLKHESADIRAESALQIALMGYEGIKSPEILPSLLTALEDENTEVRRTVVIAVGSQGYSKIALPYLIQALVDESEDVRWSAARSLKSWGTKAKSALPFLQKTLQDESIEVRTAACEALTSIQGKCGR